MQGKQLLLAIGGAVLLISAVPAFAVMSAPEGWYVEANGGSTYLTKKSYPGSSSSSGIGGNVNAGYKFMPYLATEIGYSRYANTTVKDNTDTTAGTDMHYSYDIAFKGIVPIAGSGVEAFAKLGGERVTSKMSIDNSAAAANIGLTSTQHSATGLYWGLGAQYYFTPEFAIVGQWQQAQGDDSSGTLALLSLGLNAIFD